MRVRPENYKDHLAVQWLCASLDKLLGSQRLADAAVLMGGYGSVLDHEVSREVANAVFSLRQLGLSLSSETGLRRAVYKFQQWVAENKDKAGYVEQPYAIAANEAGIPFRRTSSGSDPRIDEMVRELTMGLETQAWGREFADPSKVFTASTKSEVGRIMTFDLREVAGSVPTSPLHETEPHPRLPVTVSMAELEEVARRFDEIDEANPSRPSGKWLNRLKKDGRQTFDVMAVSRDGDALKPVGEMTFEGTKHLIGLPGTGKTTIITLMVALLHEKGLQTVVLLPSIETSFNLLSTLADYGVEAGLLTGQSAQSRMNHADRLAHRIASVDDARGLGRTVPFADLMGLNCALAGFDQDEGEDSQFPHLDPPCNDIWQESEKSKGKKIRKLCPLSGWCGRMRAPREMATKTVWLGHVLSLDTPMSPHFSQEKMTYLEYVARNADVVIVDEVDGVQAALDRKSVTEIDLSGSSGSLANRLLEDVFGPHMSGRRQRTEGNVQDYMSKAFMFIDANRHLDIAVNGWWKNELLKEYEDSFITGNKIAWDIFGPPKDRQDDLNDRAKTEKRFNAIGDFWDACVRDSLFGLTEIEGTGSFDSGMIAEAIGRKNSEVITEMREISRLHKNWLTSEDVDSRKKCMNEMRNRVFAFAQPTSRTDGKNGVEEMVARFEFLVHATTLIMRFLTLIPAHHAMVSKGVHKTSVFKEGVSEDFKKIIPEAIIGRFAGIRITKLDNDGRTTIKVSYATFQGAPRVFLHRLCELFRHDGMNDGPAVLLTSATSHFQESPSYHIDCGPHYVLKRREAQEGWKKSVFMFQPEKYENGQAIRFSGEDYSKREKALRTMFSAFISGAEPRLKKLCNDFAPGRKVAFVVNGYAQVEMLKILAAQKDVNLARRIVAVVKNPPPTSQGDYITASQVERLGERDDWDAVIFPMKSLSRGVNIVFGGPLFSGSSVKDSAAIGTVVFLTRPHPAQESYDFVAGIVGRDSQRFDAKVFDIETDMDMAARGWRGQRQVTLETVKRILRHSGRAAAFGNLRSAFVADIMVDVLQTIGRAMRNGCKARVIFVDAAWAPKTAFEKGDDNASSSFLVQMRDILERCVGVGTEGNREIYEAIFLPFLEPMRRLEGLALPPHESIEENDLYEGEYE